MNEMQEQLEVEKTEEEKGNRPKFNVVQPEADEEGNSFFKSVGGMWRNVSKNGNEFYVLKIGKLKLLVFPNNKQ